MVSLLSALFPPKPTFTEKELGSQSGKVFLVTGAASGMGFELAKILYTANGTVYVGARSSTRAEDAIKKIQTAVPSSTGQLKPMVMDLADLSTIKPATDLFLKQETRLDILFHNAGVMEPPPGSKTAQGQDLEIGTHCLGPFTLTTLLEDVMKKTASLSPTPYAVRIVWVSSYVQMGPPPGGMLFDDAGAPKVLPKVFDNYMQSKVGSVWLAREFGTRLDTNGIFSAAVHPGLMRTELQKTMPLPGRIIMSLVFKSAIYGAYTQLFAAFSPTLKAKENGGYIIAWGRVDSLPADIEEGAKTKEAGGNGKSKLLLTYCENETKAYL